MEQTRLEHLLIFGSFVVVTWFCVIYFLPAMILNVFKRGILKQGFGDGPIPINTLYTQPQASFSDPLAAPASTLMTTGVNRDTIITIGWLDLSKGPQILRVPEMAERYYSVQIIDPSKNTNFAYIGKRSTGTGDGAYLISGPGWKGDVPHDMTLISAPKNSALVVGRILVANDHDLSIAYGLARQIKLSPLTRD